MKRTVIFLTVILMVTSWAAVSPCWCGMPHSEQAKIVQTHEMPCHASSPTSSNNESHPCCSGCHVTVQVPLPQQPALVAAPTTAGSILNHFLDTPVVSHPALIDVISDVDHQDLFLFSSQALLSTVRLNI
ncbi:MAG: hypothetical protein COV74_10495 [Candidatus Omnitrophica bacterium CG11_big_fil_rev_8_21_14_0_20_45_26]|uniref:Uncharacterized protein n=1 Tax=Candidatus Abzuiibacterium crystallinum TaxID=1974748 RepID=A0A2H0LKR9_9BACT|nr:MAG: hypothetical protein COV74_10495 [Candidatus Omnitrophica bacterium CG11_big_fil_rev_8_21_14_0_20_45_26]PIW63905.1 MAG: hypothetical protein COW12_08320 [Candidatus Omnitrophica bacterium CG12_big_fil_rev_8_21_14_0_65_45_16]